MSNEPPQASALQVGVRSPTDPLARHCLANYVRELAERFETGFDPSQSLPATDADLVPPAGVLLVATLDGEPVGCVALKFHGPEPAEVKRMWVARDARGRGLGRRLLAEAEAEAAARGVGTLRLETNRALTEAMGLYRSAGYREVPAVNEERYVDGN
jgi:GNAT superfamily N-acetyltransferase